MSKITFTHLSVRNFNSWKRLEFPLSEQGVVCLKGQVGGGKSSVFKAIYWCLFGTTSENILADEIRGSKKPTKVTLQMCKDAHEYTLTRHRGHPLLKNKVEFSGYGIPRTDEDSLIKDVQVLINTFLGITPQVFLTTTYFAQRNFHVFHSLSDTGKKEWLESITYGSLFPECERIVRDKTRELERTLDYEKGKLNGLRASLTSVKNEAEKKYESYKRRITAIEETLPTLKQDGTAKKVISDKLTSYLNIMDDKESIISYSTRKLRSLEEEKEAFDRKPYVCDKCGSTISVKVSTVIITKNVKSIDAHKKTIQSAKHVMKTLTPVISKLRAELQVFADAEEEITVLKSELRMRKDVIKELETLGSLENEITLSEKSINSLETKIQYLRFWIHGFGFQGLRTYVLQSASAYLLNRLKYYLSQLASLTISVELKFIKNRILLSFNGRSYGALSGGERQSVDLCTGFALRDLAEYYNKCRFNISLYDEPFENLDDALTSSAQSLLLSAMRESTFFITHRSLNVRFDKVLLIEKDKNSKLRNVYV